MRAHKPARNIHHLVDNIQRYLPNGLASLQSTTTTTSAVLVPPASKTEATSNKIEKQSGLMQHQLAPHKIHFVQNEQEHVKEVMHDVLTEHELHGAMNSLTMEQENMSTNK